MARISFVRRSAVSAAAVLAFALTGCFTGERPSFSDDATAMGTFTGDRAVDAVLARLDRAPQARFKADYEILARYGGVRADAEVVHGGPQRRRVVIGDVEFVVQDGATSTCRADGDCRHNELDDSFVSDLQVTHRFYSDAAAAKLRRDAVNATDEADAWTQDFAGRTATCVTVHVSGGDKRYCALNSGALALQDGPDVHIELTGYSNQVRPRDFRTD